MKDKWINIVIVFLVLLALVFGYYIFTLFYGSDESTTGQKTPSTVDRISDIVTGNSNESGSVEEFDEGSGKRSLTSDEIAVLSFPEQDASESEYTAHSDLVNSLVEYAEVLDVTDCFPTPVVYGVDINDQVTFRNNGQTAVTIQSGSKTTVVESGAITSHPLSDLMDEVQLGDHGYGCSGGDNEGIVGIIKVTSTE